MMYLRLELKVCEACGTLWLRSKSDPVYCTPCSLRLVNFPERRKHAGGRPRRIRNAAHSATHTTNGGAR